jgi:hypothetical protein
MQAPCEHVTMSELVGLTWIVTGRLATATGISRCACRQAAVPSDMMNDLQPQFNRNERPKT